MSEGLSLKSDVRKRTRVVKIGRLAIGGNNTIAIQSMTSTDTEDIDATLDQIRRLVAEGCEIIRVSFPTERSIAFIPEFKREFSLPLVADIHFDHNLALKAIEAGADKVRINPGNIGSDEKVRQVIRAARAHAIPIRIGVNGGSLPATAHTANGLLPVTNAALDHIRFFEQEGFENIVISAKMSDVPATLRAYQEIAARCDYPLHVGVTEAGTQRYGIVKSSVGIGAILAQGIGDTIRVSLTGDPAREVSTAKYILQSLGLRRFGPELISCPTCSRTKVELESIALAVEEQIAHIDRHITVAVMGCAVNGPGEARHADYGVACGQGEGLLFKKGTIIKKVSESQIVQELVNLIMERTEPNVQSPISAE